MREHSGRQIRAARAHTIVLGRKTAAERIASFLLEMTARMKLDERARIELVMPRIDIADYLGLTAETVCRQFKQLRLDGTIAVHGTTIAIHDMRTLKAADQDRTVH
jgi:CRP-like cAMP-binding protein